MHTHCSPNQIVLGRDVLVAVALVVFLNFLVYALVQWDILVVVYILGLMPVFQVVTFYVTAAGLVFPPKMAMLKILWLAVCLFLRLYRH